MPQYYIPKKEFKVLTEEETLPYLKYSKVMAALIALMYNTGARISECLLLRRKDIIIDNENKEVRVKLVTLKREDRAIREEIIGFNDPFIVEFFIPYAESKVKPESRLFRKTKRRYQQKLLLFNRTIHGDDTTKYITFHYLRHSAITHISRDLRATPWEIQAFTGHKSSAYDDYMIISAPRRFKDNMSHSSSS
jgi:integrase